MNRMQNVLGAAALMLAVASPVAAQTTAPGEVMFHWGPLHLGPGQALAINFELTDHIGGPLTLPVELQIEDKNGNVVYRNAIDVSDGHAISFAIGPDVRTLRSVLPADVYAIVGPDVRPLHPCIKVIYPPGPGTPVDRMTLTLEVIDVLTGRVVGLANNPHAIIGVLAQ